MNEFGDLLREKRLECNLTLRELSARIGISVSYLSDVEHGRRGPFSDKYLDALDEVFTGDDVDELIIAATIHRGSVFIPVATGEQTEAAFVFAELLPKLDERGCRDLESTLRGLLRAATGDSY